VGGEAATRRLGRRRPARGHDALSEYGEAHLSLALRGLEAKTLDPYLSGWRKRVLPVLGHLPVRVITNGAVDRAVHAWIAEDASRSTVKNSLAVLVRVMEQAYRDGIIDRNPARITGWQASSAAPRTSSTTRDRWPYPTGRPWRPSPPRWSRGRPRSSQAGVVS
jgi:hypothetical protein